MIISSIKPIARMLLMLWMVATVGCSLFPSAPSGVTDTEISYGLQHNSSSDVIMVKCPGNKYKYGALSGNFMYDSNLNDKAGFMKSDDGLYIWMAWKKEDMSVPNLNVHCGQYQYKAPGTSTFNILHWSINLNSTSTTDFLESVDLLSISDIVGDPMEGIDKCGKSSDELKIISKDRNGTLSIVGKIMSNNLRSKNVYYFFDEKTIMNNTEFLTPCGVADVYHNPPTILIDGNKLVEIAGTDGIKEKSLVKAGENKLSLKLENQAFQDMKDFYKGEKVMLKKVLYHNGKAEIKEGNGIEASENFIVTGYEILEISYQSLTTNRNYKDVKEVVFFGPVDKDIELERHLINITAADVPYQLNCSYTKLDYAYLYEVKADDEVMEVKKLATDGAVVGNFRRSGDLILYKPVDVEKMDWVCIYKTPNGKVVVPFQLVRTDGNKEQNKDTSNNQGGKNVSSRVSCNVFLYWSWIFFAVLAIESSAY